MHERQLATMARRRRRHSRHRHLVLLRPAQSLHALVVLSLSAAFLVTVYWAADLLLLRQGPPPRADAAVLEWITGRRTTATTGLAELLSAFGDLIVVLPVAAALLVLVVRRARRWDTVALVVTVVFGVLAITTVVKELTLRARPSDGHLVEVVSHAFPSGHASRAAAIYGLLWWVALRWGRSAITRVLGGALAVGMIAATGMSRLVLGVHWPTDVLFGWLLGIAWLGVCVLLLQPRHGY